MRRVQACSQAKGSVESKTSLFSKMFQLFAKKSESILMYHYIIRATKNSDKLYAYPPSLKKMLVTCLIERPSERTLSFLRSTTTGRHEHLEKPSGSVYGVQQRY